MNKPVTSLAALLALAAAPGWTAAPDPAAVLDSYSASAAGVFAGFSKGRAPKLPPSQPGVPTRSPRAPKKPVGQPPAQGAPGKAQPDWGFTPGRLCQASDPDFKEYRYAERIPYCNRNVTTQMKQEVAAHYGIPESEWVNYEFDHLIPLAVGGNSHVDNLWPQPRTAGNSPDKDKLENDLYLKMQAGTMTQAEAVKEIYAWFGKAPPAN